MLFKGPGIISVDLKPCLLAVPQFHSGNVRVKPIFVGFRHKDYSSFFRARRMCWRQNPAPVYGISVDRFPDHMPTYSVSEVLLASARTNAEKKGCREDHDPSRLDPVRTKSTFSVGHFLPENIASTKEKVCCSAASPRATESANFPWGYLPHPDKKPAPFERWFFGRAARSSAMSSASSLSSTR